MLTKCISSESREMKLRTLLQDIVRPLVYSNLEMTWSLVWDGVRSILQDEAPKFRTMLQIRKDMEC